MEQKTFGYCNFSNKNKNCLSYKSSKKITLFKIRIELDQYRSICENCKKEFYSDFDFNFFDNKKIEIKSKLEENKSKYSELGLKGFIEKSKKKDSPSSIRQQKNRNFESIILEEIKNNNNKANTNFLNKKLMDKKLSNSFNLSLGNLYHRLNFLVEKGFVEKLTTEKGCFYSVKMEG